MTTKRHCGLDPQSPDNMEMLNQEILNQVQDDESGLVISNGDSVPPNSRE
jgi:hypothetical protein